VDGKAGQPLKTVSHRQAMLRATANLVT
jgi:hypothetical protein